jgi:hypothetical protein
MTCGALFLSVPGLCGGGRRGSGRLSTQSVVHRLPPSCTVGACDTDETSATEPVAAIG